MGMSSPNYEKLAESAFKEFSDALNFDGNGKKNHGCGYGMEKRLMLASKLAEDGKRKVLELASSRGITTFAMRRYGIDVVSTEIEMPLCRNELSKVNPGHVVRCNAFRPPFKEKSFDAIVSYNFFGEGYMTDEFAKGRSLRDVFEELSLVADTVYSVELQENYSGWFTPLKELPKNNNNGFEPDELKTRFERTLGEGWDVSYLGPFGIWIPAKNETGRSGIYERVGFKFTKTTAKHG